MRLALAEKGSDAFVGVSHQRIHGHHITRVLIRRVLIHVDLGIKGALADTNDQRTGGNDLVRNGARVFLQLLRRHCRVD